MTLRVPEELRRRLERAAKRRGVSLNKEAISRLEESVRCEDLPRDVTLRLALYGLAAAKAFGPAALNLARAQEGLSKMAQELATKIDTSDFQKSIMRDFFPDRADSLPSQGGG
jgi:HicB-like protein involved in pilus formation